MADDEYEDLDDLDPSSFEDTVAQRACAFVHLAQFADRAVNVKVLDLTLAMMRKVSASIKTPSTAELTSIEGGKPKD